MGKSRKDETGQFTSPNPVEYFWANVKKDRVSGCWNWKGNMFNTGYGAYKNKQVNNGVVLAASRAAWILFKDQNLGRWDFICHSCDNRRCVNYENHLFCGTGKDNMQDASTKRRINHGEDRPQSKLTENMVREMRQLRQSGMGWQKLAKRFGVSGNCIISAVTGITWSHVDEPIPTYVGKAGRKKGSIPWNKSKC